MLVERRNWYWVDWALFAIMTFMFGLGLLYIFIEPKELIGDGSFLFASAWILASYFVPLLFWRPGYVNKLLFPISILLTSGILELYSIYHTKQWTGFILFPLMIAGFLTDRRTIWWNIVVFLLGVPLIEYFFILGKTQPVRELIGKIIQIGLLFGIGYSINRVLSSNLRIRRLYEENLHQYRLIQEQNKALEQYAKQVEKLTLLEERNRLARELHDTVGHTFTSVIMGMDAVSYLIETAPDKAKEKLDVLREVTRNGLEEVRRSIHQIAPQNDDGTLSQQLSRLANEFALHTGTQVRIRHEGNEYEVPRQMQLTLIRCLQEALTNAKRHGQASTVDIIMRFQDNQLLLRVEDDGLGTEKLEPGFGLTAMRERLAALQGTLHAASSPGAGTVITCTIPITPSLAAKGTTSG